MKYAWLKAMRWRRLREQCEEPLRAMLSSALPPASSAFEEVEFLAVDIETTGLDPATAEMLSIGWVIIRNGVVVLDTSRSRVVRPTGEVGASASVHGLTDTFVGSGDDWGDVLDSIVSALAGRVLLVHHAGLDKALLDRMCLRRYGAKLLVPVVDTLALEMRRRLSKHHLGPGVSLKLPDLRAAYSLPRYAGHDCLVDAIATAELLVAMAAHRGTPRLGELLA
jgi:DNA polymerase-3 subunit epsilon